MNTIVEIGGTPTVHVRLSRRNLRALIAKLDGKPAGSMREISRYVESGWVLVITAEEDDVHYGARVPGPMHDETEKALSAKTRAECDCEVKKMRPADERATGGDIEKGY